MSLYVNGDDVNIQQRQLLQSAITDYSRVMANPSPPASIITSTINPPRPSNISQDLGTLYTTMALLVSFLVSTSLVGSLLVEEKEKKTLRMLMVSPVSFGDVVAGKLVVGLGYQLLLSLVVLVIEGGFYNAITSKTVFSDALLDTIVILGCTAILLLASVWILRRQASVVAAI